MKVVPPKRYRPIWVVRISRILYDFSLIIKFVPGEGATHFA